MKTLCGANVLLALFVVIYLHDAVTSQDVVGLPPFNVNQRDFMQSLKLGDDIKFEVPALYVFGDSTVDSGNNNGLTGNSSVSDYLPYGVDFDGGKATGRFTNGRVEPDFIAQLLGLPFPPPCEGLSQTPLTGVNYGSGSCGIIPRTFMGECTDFGQQIDHFQATLDKLKPQFDSTESIDSYLSKSLFFIGIGNTDLSEGIGYKESDIKEGKLNFSEYAHHVYEEFQKLLQRLYNLGARKFLVNNIGALVCMPSVLAKRNVSNPTQCVDDNDDQNPRVNEYNRILFESLPLLQSTLPGSKFVYADVNKALKDVIKSPNLYGITELRNPCCKFDTIIEDGVVITLPCSRAEQTPCNDRNKHAYFDPYHVSETVHFLWAKRCLTESSICSPTTLVELLQA